MRFRVALILLGVLSLITLWILSRGDLDGMLRFPDRLAALPTIQANYGQISQMVTGATNDILLERPPDEDEIVHLVRGENYAGCIRGGFTRTYGANRTFDDVLVDFGRALSGFGWQVDSGYGGAASTTFRIQVYRLDAVSSGWREKYQTIYQVSLTYSDPSVQACYG